MEAIGIYYDIVQTIQTPTGPFGWSILVWGVTLFTIASLSIIVQLWWHIHRIETPIEAVIKELKSKKIWGFSMLEIFDALRDRFALGLPLPEAHNVLRDRLNKDAGWGLYSSDIFATFTTRGLIHSTSIDPNYSSVLLDFKYTAPNYIYQLTDIGKLLASKLKSEKPKIGKGASQKQ